MLDQSILTTVRNTSANDHRGTVYTDIHAETISNVLNLGSSRKRYNKSQAGRNNLWRADFERLVGPPRTSSLYFSRGSFSGIGDSYFDFGSLVSIPELKKRQLALIMSRNTDKKRKNKYKGENSDAVNTTFPEEENQGELPSTYPMPLTDAMLTPLSPTAASLTPSELKPSNIPSTNTSMTTSDINDKESTTARTPIDTTTDLFSSEETVVMTTGLSSFTITSNNIEVGDNTNEEEEEDIILSKDELDFLATHNDIRMTTASRGELDAVMFPSQRATVKKRRMDRINFCGTFSLNFGNRRIGMNCCMRTLNCFDNLPTYLDESVFHKGNHQFTESERTHLCYDMNDAFTCTRRILGRSNCRIVTELLDSQVQPQMSKVRQYYQSVCPADPEVVTTPTVTKTTKSSSSFGAIGWGPVPGSVLPFVWGALAGLFFIAILMLIVIVCRKQCNKRKRRTDSNETNYELDASPRYKSVNYNMRRRSSVYEEIDENQMIGLPPSSKDSKSMSSPKTPSAPKQENHYYLSPTSSLPEVKDSKLTELGLTNFGYLELQTDENGQSYAKLKTDGDYISVNEIASVSQKDKPQKEETHTYFVLERDDTQSDNQNCSP